MFKDKYTKELAKSGDISLVMYVSEDDKGEHTQYVTCRWYDPTKPVGQQWYGGVYSRSLENAMESFRYRTGRMTYARLEEIATRFKDVLVDEFAFTRDDFAEDGDGSYRNLDLNEKELNDFEIPEDIVAKGGFYPGNPDVWSERMSKRFCKKKLDFFEIPEDEDAEDIDEDELGCLGFESEDEED